MNKKILITILLMMIISSGIFIQQASSDAITQPTKLKIYVGPTRVPADNGAYNCIFIQLQDSAGKPARAVQDTVISLSSSLASVGTVDSSITILSNSTYSTAKFYSTFIPGTTTITATATGYTTAQSSITTVGTIPSAIAIYGFPSILPIGGGSYDAIMIQLQDSSGSPVKAPEEGIQVTLTCSDTNIGTVNSPITIPAGKTYAIATFTTSQTKGQATITAMTPGYSSKQLTIKTQDIATIPSRLRIFQGPTRLLADNKAYTQIAIQLQNSIGNLAVASQDLTINITSSDETVGKVETQITIPQSETYVLATLTTTYKAGTTTLTATANNLTTSTATISTIGSYPTKLAVYCVPLILPADRGTYNSIQVQLQDSQGRPVPNPESDVNINLSSSKPEIGGLNSTLTIPVGETQATGVFFSTNSPGSTTITAQASNYTSAQATITTYVIDYSTLQVLLTANPENVSNGNKTQITAYITADGNPIANATLRFTSNNGGGFTITKQQAEGFYTTNFTAPSFSKPTVCTITASATKTGFISSQGSVEITVGSTNQSPTMGTMQLQIQDKNENSLSDTTIASIIQPKGTTPLSGITNESGYVIFKNVTFGVYTFQIAKDGFNALNQTINFVGQPITMKLPISINQSEVNYTLPLVLIGIAAISIGTISGWLIMSRRKPKYMKLMEPIAKPPAKTNVQSKVHLNLAEERKKRKFVF